MILDRISLTFVILGALNAGGIGLFRFDTISWICGGPATLPARIAFTIISLAGLWCISLLFRSREAIEN